MRIPSPFVGAFAALRDLSADQFDALVDALTAAKPTLSAGDLAHAVTPTVDDVDTSLLSTLLQALTSLTGLRRMNRWSVDEAAKEVASSEDLATPAEDQPALIARLTTLMSIRSVSLLGKAIDTGTEHDKVFVAARVLTDVRPLFGDDVKALPEAALVTHTLKLEFAHDAGRIGNCYVVLDEDDVATLRQLLDRADNKANTLKSMLGKIGLPYLEKEGD